MPSPDVFTSLAVADLARIDHARTVTSRRFVHNGRDGQAWYAEQAKAGRGNRTVDGMRILVPAEQAPE